ncbi:MAG: PQQ-binding-like beta-propeller repeat protein [Candidatus Riflebacteria bacterium]|mgnify:CR=1 FL=1|nr:PQQ-binding-like beta-propeller repeat protein [Candidatus Riflebacteria bacterium]
MSSRLLGVILIIISILAFHLLGSQPETQAIWQRSISEKIYSDPLAVGDRFVFIGGDKGKREYKLYEIDANGNTTAQSVQLPNLPYEPLAFENLVVVGDYARMIRGFSVPGLKLAWESGTIEPFRIPPIKSGENLIVQSTSDSLFCLDSKTGEPVWDHTFTDTLVNYGVDKTIVCLHGYADLKNPQWKATALDADSGEVLWTSTSPLAADTPLFVQNICVLASNEGEMLIVDQFTGKLLYKHPVKGLKSLQVLNEHLIMLAAGGSRLICMSLMDGSSWTTTMQSNLTGIARYGNRLLIADKKALRCLSVDDGSSFWTRNLEDVYNALPYRNGIFVTHKDSFFARTTFGSYIETDKSASRWIAHGSSNFMKPLLTNSGELLLAYNGDMRMMPKSSTGDSSTDISIPGAKTPGAPDFWKNKNASDTGAPAQTLSDAATATVTASETRTEVTEEDDEADEEKPAIPKEIAPPVVDDWNKKDGL